jgi:hypothetical protein
MNLLQRIVSSLIVPSSRRETLRAEAQLLRFETLETRRLLATLALSDFSVSQGTGEKPQSKVWEYADQWWTVMPSSAGAAVWRLDGTTWTRTLQLSTNNNVTADVKAVGGLTHVLLFDGAASQLASIEYDGAGNYVPWTMRPQLVGVPLSGAETATIDVDTTGRLWVAADNGSLVQVRYSDGLYQSWSSPITVASGIGSDDISVITALPNGTVGVLWSNQNSKRFGYRYHVDGASPTEWSVAESPASAAALSTGGGMADDHLNVAVAADGTLYAAVKTSYDSGGQTKIGLIVRRPNGQWDNALYPVDTSGTRPIVLLNEAAGKLIVAYAASEGTANIVYRETSLASISFGPRQTMISGSIQNVSSTKQNFNDEVALIASNGGTVKSVLFSFGSIVVNQPPSVNAGLDQSIVIGAAAALNANVQDDGRPAVATAVWSKLSGPGVVAFDDSTKLNARATFSLPGTYVLRITATDGQYVDADDVTIVVAAPAPDPSPSEIVAAAFQDGVAGYTGTRDTMIRALNASTNYGTLATLEMDGSPDIASLVAWDVSAIPAGSVVASVSFELYVTNTTVHSYSVFAMERAWDELGATWNVAGVARPWSTAGASSASDRNGSALGSITSRSAGTLRVDLNAAGRAAVQEWINDPTSNHGLIFQNYGDASDGLDFRSSETSTVSQRPRLLITYATSPPVEPQNAAPAVNAGTNLTVVAGQAAMLTGTATDDGQPGPLAVLWTQYSGPGSVAFANASSGATSASFSTPGTYVLRLTASDGEFSTYDELIVTVTAAAPNNLPPTVSAGTDGSIQFGSTATLVGTVSDDGLPGPVTMAWTKALGPGSVTFSSAANATTTASFSQSGTYVLRLSASDGQLSAQDEVAITVQAPAPNQAPTVAAGTDQTYQQGSTAPLAGTVTDDGPASSVTSTWSKVSGPGSVAFVNANANSTQASFSAPGVYVLRLTASDGSLTAFDEVTITITAPPTADPSLLGDWRMDAIAGGTTSDSSGAGRTATVVGAPSLTTGVYGQALSFNKSNYLLVDNAPALNPSNQITIAAWIKPTTSGTQYVVRKGRQDSTDGYELSLSSDGKVFVRFNQASSGDAFRVNSTSKYPTNGSTWLHVAATYDGSTIKLYVNGVLQGSKNATFQIASNSLPLAIGAQDDGYRGFAGAIDGVKLFNRALTAAEIVALKASV